MYPLIYVSLYVVTRCSWYTHMQPVLKDLHWLPVNRRIEHKILVYTYRALYGLAPSYLSSMVEWYKPTRSLRSADQWLLKTPITNMKTYGDRTFAMAAPTLWNSLPQSVRKASSLDSFRSAAKTYFFSVQ